MAGADAEGGSRGRAWRRSDDDPMDMMMMVGVVACVCVCVCVCALCHVMRGRTCETLSLEHERREIWAQPEMRMRR